MKWSDLPLQPNDRTLRQFAVLWLVFFAAIALWQLFIHQRTTASAVIGSLAIVVGLFGLVQPRWIRPIFVTWMVFAFPIGWVISNVLLTILFYALFTPMGWIFRSMGRDALRLVPQPHRDSYWEPRAKLTDSRQYFRQF